jgi:hypothetical protein
MRIPSAVRPVALFAACALLAAGCRRGERADAAGPAKMDTANTAWEDGMSAQQVESEAQAMSPEQAAQAGLSVDTTIHLEELGPRDSVPGGGAAPTPAPATSGAGRADTLPAAAPPVGARPQSGNEP